MIRGAVPIALLLALPPAAARAQARIEAVFPDPSRVAVQQLGAARAIRATAGLDLQPGDLLTAADTSYLELLCMPAGSTTYRLRGPFRFFIDVPDTAGHCHMNLLSGDANVIAEEPTGQTVGAVNLTSHGTQYAIIVRRDSAGIAPRIVVFDGEVSARTSSGDTLTARPGMNLDVSPRSARPSLGRTTPQQLKRWAGIYANFDMDEGLKQGVIVNNRSASYDSLSVLHYEVLANPGDTERRVALARAQIRYRVPEHANFNLRRAGVTTDDAARRYNIDPAILRVGRMRSGGSAAGTTTAALRAANAGTAGSAAPDTAKKATAGKATTAASRAAVKTGSSDTLSRTTSATATRSRVGGSDGAR